jgi:hypothetical protein
MTINQDHAYREARKGGELPTYVIRNLPEPIWTRVKARSEAEGIPLRAVILKLLELYGLGEVVIRAERPDR